MDVSTITSLLSGITSATQIAKLIKESGSSLEQAEVKLKLADLIVAHHIRDVRGGAVVRCVNSWGIPSYTR